GGGGDCNCRAGRLQELGHQRAPREQVDQRDELHFDEQAADQPGQPARLVDDDERRLCQRSLERGGAAGDDGGVGGCEDFGRAAVDEDDVGRVEETAIDGRRDRDYELQVRLTGAQGAGGGENRRPEAVDFLQSGTGEQGE